MEEESNKNQLSVVKNNYLAKVSNTLSITNKLLNEIDNREPSDDFRVAIPDVNFQKYLSEALGVIVSDGTVAYGDVKWIGSINCSNTSIASLEGIEYFSDLEILYCSNNNITSIDLTKNLELKSLEFLNNGLISLNVTENLNLYFLDCGSNQLSYLDVSKNINLNILWCDNNHLTNLDVTKNTKLTSLRCASNQLINLDVLNNINLITLEFFSNYITHIDISKNKELIELNGEAISKKE